MIAIIDYGCGNPASIRNMLKKIGYPSEITSDPEKLRMADKLILPGVGSFDHGIKQLEEKKLLSVLEQRVVNEGVPILGICLGVQLFCAKSEEGQLKGLNWIDADVVKFDSSKMSHTERIPHMGWTDTTIKRNNRLIPVTDELPRYYYVHSYHLNCHSPQQVIATAHYGYQFVSVVEKDNIVGVQFHPEKSHRFGMVVLKHFVENYS